MKGLLPDLETLALAAGTLGGAIILVLAIHYLLFQTVIGLARRTSPVLYDSLMKHGRGPSRIIVPLLAVYFSLPLIEISPKINDLLDKALIILLISSVAWLLVRLTSILEDLVLS